jgi:GntR family transcriptional regulator
MMIMVERSSEEPIYEQIARQIREMVASGELPAGTRLPTVRELASDLGVNLNTVARAYRLLEEEGFVLIRDRSGAEVTSPARKPESERQRLCQELKKILARMFQAGMTQEEMRRASEAEIDSLGRRQSR